MKTLFKKPKNSIIAIFLLVVFLSTTLLAVVPQSAQAATGDSSGSFIDDATLTKVKDHQKYFWLRACFNDIDIDKV